MHARVVTGQSRAGQVEEAIRLYKEFVVPAAKQQTGFKGAFLLTQPETDKFTSISLWETEADMVAGEASGYFKEVLGKVAPTFAVPPTNEHYEVSVQA